MPTLLSDPITTLGLVCVTLVTLAWIRFRRVLDRTFLDSARFRLRVAYPAPGMTPSPAIVSGTRWAMQTPLSFTELLETLQRDAPSARFRVPIGWWWEAEQPALTQVALVGGINHILLTGQTNSGKDSWARVVCLALAGLHGPDEIQFCFVDGKGLDCAPWASKAHTWGLALDPPEIGLLLQRLQAERLRRTRILRAAGVTQWEAAEHPPFPLLLVYISELSLLQDAIGSTALEQWLNTELGAGRAVGMRYLVATQTVSNFATRWRSQISLWVAGYQPSKQQDAPNTGLTTAELLALGVTPPSQLPAPPTGAGVITAVDAGRRAATVRATVVDVATHRRLLAALPERPAEPEESGVSSVSTATTGSGDTHFMPRRSVAHARLRHRSTPEHQLHGRNETQPFQGIATDVSVVAMADSADTPAFPEADRAVFVPLARLVHAGLVTETKLLETAFNVRAGSSEAYRTARTGLKQALAELEKTDN